MFHKDCEERYQKLHKAYMEVTDKLIRGNHVIDFENVSPEEFEPRQPTDEERTAVTMIVNSPQYDDFRSFMLRYAVGFYNMARQKRDSSTHVLNEMGKEVEGIVTSLDS